MKLNLSAIVAIALATSASLGAAEKISTGTINVFSVTPLPTIGLPLDLIPSNIQVINRADLKNQAGVSIADFAANNLQGVSINETQGNPFQPDITFRGYSASPLDGNPQGISVYLDGVRVNEPFGDTVRWDLIPSFAIQGMQLIPGSNPLFGLNTLGGAISIQTKNGRTNPGAAIEASGGSWGRKNVSAEYGGVSKDGSVDYYLGVNYHDEDGWRDYSPTTVKQTFGKVGWQNESSKIDVSYLNANNDMVGNGLVPSNLINTFGNESIYTRPDQTRNFLNQLTLNGSHWINNDVMLSVNSYYRGSNRNTVNGDITGEDYYRKATTISPRTYFCSTEEDRTVSTHVAGYSPDYCQGVMNYSKTRNNSYGISSQLAFNQNVLDKKNQFILGVGYDRSLIKYDQSRQMADFFDSSRMPIDLKAREEEASLKGKTQTWHILATDTMSLNNLIHLTASARFNRTEVDNVDKLILRGVKQDDDGSLTGSHTFNRLNPSLGLTLTPAANFTAFGSYSESSRAPSSIELGCADPAHPCLLPNAMAGDPPLKQVVAKTFDFGLRGNILNNIKWSASAYRATNLNDIQFIYAKGSGSEGYFSNVGETQRQGIDLGLKAETDKFRWNASYSYIQATYESDFTAASASNSSKVSKDDPSIQVKSGDYMPNIPKHQLKLRAEYQANSNWVIGTNLIAFTSQYMAGNENNDHKAGLGGAYGSDKENIYNGSGKIPGYAIINLDTRFNIGNGWQVFAKAINIFDKEYVTAGRLAVNSITNSGIFDARTDLDEQQGGAFVAPGAPRAGWIGVRYEFGGADKK
jgi:outer membrane receptor protein involved in Fe transport